MSRQPDHAFNVDFCNDMTMSCTDECGLLKFVFEVASERRPGTVILYKGAVDANLKDILRAPQNQCRIDSAFESVIAYLRGLDYDVDIID